MNTNLERNEQQRENSPDTPLDIGDQHTEALATEYEKSYELTKESKERNSEHARAEALETAISAEHSHSSKETISSASPGARRAVINKRDLETNYQQTMKHVQNNLSPQSRAFSKIIHHKAIEQTSDALASTIARPNAVLAGAIGAFVVTLAIYLVAKNFGYRLSGSETIAGFVIGWIAGLLYDYFKVMITGKRP